MPKLSEGDGALTEIVRWQHADLDGRDLYIAEITDGFLIASIDQPRFCLYGASKESVICQASRAIAFAGRLALEREG